MEIKKIAVRGGHTELCTGAVALLNELTEDRKVTAAVVKYLKALGYEVLDVTPPVNYTSSVSADLAYGVNKANEWGADLFVSIHFNKAYDSYNGALGSEVCVYSTHDIAQRVVNGLGELGFKNRGQKIRKELYELRNKRLGADAVGKKIAEAIVNGKAAENTTPVQKEEARKPQSTVSNTDSWVRRLQEECNKQGFSNQSVDGIAGSNTLKGCPTVRQGARGNITKLIQERLVTLGYNTNGVDGIFGNGTKNAVIAFQKSKGLSVDGIVGTNTWRKLLNL